MGDGVQYREFKSAYGERPRRDVACPRCGGPTTEHKLRPKWRCEDPRCAFKEGFKLIPAGGRGVLATPYYSDGTLAHALAVPWPHGATTTEPKTTYDPSKND